MTVAHNKELEIRTCHIRKTLIVIISVGFVQISDISFTVANLSFAIFFEIYVQEVLHSLYNAELFYSK